MSKTGGMAGTAAAASADPVHAWDRLDRMWTAVFHLTLGAATVVALAGSSFDPLRSASLVAGAAAVVVARRQAVRALVGVEEGGRRHLAVGLAWTAVTLPAMVFLMNAEGAYFFGIYGLFPQTFIMLPRNWAVGISAALVPAVLVGAEGVSALGDSGFAVSVVGSALLAPAIGLFVSAISRQSEQRHHAILALEAANEEAESLLQASLAISRARTAGEVVEAVGACLAGPGLDRLALCVGDEELAVWRATGGGSQPEGASDETTATVTVQAPVSGVDSGEGRTLTLRASGDVALSAASRRTLETLVISCGLALANFALVDQARQAGVADERARLAREIHDTLAQGFVSVLTQLEAAADPLSGAPAGAVERVRRAAAIARSSLGEARRSVQALRPEALEAAPLSAAIGRVVARWSDDAGVDAGVTLTGRAVALPPATEVTLLRATQEALANVARHAAATSVSVTLSYLGDAVVLDVHDDGSGFDRLAPRNGSGGGFGLEALRQRVDAAGGYFGLESEPGGGTTVTVHIPLPTTNL